MTPQTPNPPDLVHAALLRWLATDGLDPAPDTLEAGAMANELLLAREVLGLLTVGNLRRYFDNSGWAFWHRGRYEDLPDIRPDLAAYLNGLPQAFDPCPMCARIAESGWGGPSHDGISSCRSGSLASGGPNAHCTCDACF